MLPYQEHRKLIGASVGVAGVGEPVEDGQPGQRRAARSRRRRGGADAHRVQLGAERVDGRRGPLDDAVLRGQRRELEGTLGQRQRREGRQRGGERRLRAAEAVARVALVCRHEGGEVLREGEGRVARGREEGVVVERARGRRQVTRRAEAAEAAHRQRLGSLGLAVVVDVADQALARLVRVVDEVAARAVRAEARRVEGAAQLGLVLGVPGQRAQLVATVRELALVAVLARAALLERPAQLGLVAARVLRGRRHGRWAGGRRRGRRWRAGQRRPPVHGLAVAPVQLPVVARPRRGGSDQRSHRADHVAADGAARHHAATGLLRARRLRRRRPQHHRRHRGRGAA